METENALTNFSPSNDKISRVLGLQKITLADIEDFTGTEREFLGEITTEMLQQLKGEERDSFINKIAQIIPQSTNDQIWERNHYIIGKAIAKLMGQYGAMPPKFLIAQETDLSRQTVAKHITDYKTHPQYLAEIEQFKFMTLKFWPAFVSVPATAMCRPPGFILKWLVP